MRCGIFGHSSFEKVCLACEGNEIHEIEGIEAIEQFAASEGIEKSVGNEFDVLQHCFGV